MQYCDIFKHTLCVGPGGESVIYAYQGGNVWE